MQKSASQRRNIKRQVTTVRQQTAKMVFRVGFVKQCKLLYSRDILVTSLAFLSYNHSSMVTSGCSPIRSCNKIIPNEYVNQELQNDYSHISHLKVWVEGIRLDMISGSTGGGGGGGGGREGNFKLPSVPPPSPTLLNGPALTLYEDCMFRCDVSLDSDVDTETSAYIIE